MNAKKLIIDKDWFKQGPKSKIKEPSGPRLHKFEQMTVTKSEDLPELMTTAEAAKFLLRHPKTVEEYRKDGSLRFIKIKGRFFTTPEYVAEFIEKEMKKSF